MHLPSLAAVASTVRYPLSHVIFFLLVSSELRTMLSKIDPCALPLSPSIWPSCITRKGHIHFKASI